MADTETELDPVSPTQELHIDPTSQIPVASTEGSDGGAGDVDALFENEESEWPSRGPAKGFRVPWLMAVLLVLLVASISLWAGAYLQRHSSSSASATSPFGGGSPFGSGGFPGSRSSGSGGSGGFPGLPSNATSGTVTDIEGNTLYVTDSSGKLVAVTVTSNTTVNRNAKSTLSSLEPGDSVTVQGTKSKNGTVSASSVSATQAGVSSGGFGGLGALGAGAPGGSTGG